MRKKLAIILFLLTISIFLINCVVLAKYSVEDKKVLLIGRVIKICGITTDKFQNNMQSIGVMTAVDINKKQFAAFGHKIFVNYTMDNFKDISCYKSGDIHIVKEQKDKHGELNCNTLFKNKIGNVVENNSKGVFGTIEDIPYGDELDEVYVASRYKIKSGNAKLYISLDGNQVKEYDVTIQNINLIDESKNIHLKVIDKELIDKTGGIVKGMSGAPILQDGKLIGAVNAVFENDATEAYAIFADKLF